MHFGKHTSLNDWLIKLHHWLAKCFKSERCRYVIGLLAKSQSIPIGCFPFKMNWRKLFLVRRQGGFTANIVNLAPMLLDFVTFHIPLEFSSK